MTIINNYHSYTKKKLHKRIFNYCSSIQEHISSISTLKPPHELLPMIANNLALYSDDHFQSSRMFFIATDDYLIHLSTAEPFLRMYLKVICEVVRDHTVNSRSESYSDDQREIDINEEITLLKGVDFSLGEFAKCCYKEIKLKVLGQDIFEIFKPLIICINDFYKYAGERNAKVYLDI